MTIFSSKNISDAHVREQMNSNFSFIVGESRPMPKGKSKNDDSITEEMWFTELSWLHCFIFVQAFHECVARGIINAFEKQACEEIIAMIP